MNVMRGREKDRTKWTFDFDGPSHGDRPNYVEIDLILETIIFVMINLSFSLFLFLNKSEDLQNPLIHRHDNECMRSLSFEAIQSNGLGMCSDDDVLEREKM